MDSNRRNFIDIVLVIALLVVGGFLFNRAQNLDDTRTELADAQAEITQVSDTAATYSEEGTALAQQAAADAETAANQLADANATATQAANDSADALDTAHSAGTQSAEDSAATLESVNAAAIQAAADSAAMLESANTASTQAAADSADALANAESTATRAARNSANTLATAEAVGTDSAADAATQQAQAQSESEALTANLANAESTASAMQELQSTEQAVRTGLEAEIAALQTAQAASVEMADAQMTAIANLNESLTEVSEQSNAQATTIAQAEATIAAQPAQGDSGNAPGGGGSITEVTPQSEPNELGLVLFETDTVQIYLPDDYVGIDPADGLEVALSTIDALGSEYDQIGALLEQNPELFVLIAARNRPTAEGFVENINVIHQDALIAITLETFIDIGYRGLPAAFVIAEQEIIELNGQQVLRTVIDADFGAFQVKQVQYVYIIGTHVYAITASTSPRDFEERAALFEAVAATFIVRE
jgi:hypothetical protein